MKQYKISFNSTVVLEAEDYEELHDVPEIGRQLTDTMTSWLHVRSAAVSNIEIQEVTNNGK